MATDADPAPARWWREQALQQRALLVALGAVAVLALTVLLAGRPEAGPAPPAGRGGTRADAGSARTDDEPAGSRVPAGGADRERATGPDLKPRTERVSSPHMIAISSQGGLSHGLSSRVEAEPGIEVVTAVRGATLGLVATTDGTGEVVDELPEGWRLPVEVLAVDPDTYHAVLGVEEVLDLAEDQGLLSESSADVRRVGTGAVLRFGDGTPITVAGVLPDALVGAAELLVTTDSPLSIPTERYLLARTEQPLDDAGRGRLTELAGDRSVLVTGNEVPVLRHTATVMPPARLKVHFGEFAMTDGPGR